jgi:hypothetical protein
MTTLRGGDNNATRGGQQHDEEDNNATTGGRRHGKEDVNVTTGGRQCDEGDDNATRGTTSKEDEDAWWVDVKQELQAHVYVLSLLLFLPSLSSKHIYFPFGKRA